MIQKAGLNLSVLATGPGKKDLKPLLHYRSQYLQERNLVQISLMSYESTTCYTKV